MLTSRVTIPSPTTLSPEDIFSSSLSSLFTDDTENSHGTPGSPIHYLSPTYGRLTLLVPTHPSTDERRALFAHYLWNAAVIAASLIETTSSPSSPTDAPFNLFQKSTFEFGSGTALPSLIASLSGAHSVVITDHPSSSALTMDAIQTNVQRNLFPVDHSARTTASIEIRGYVWGETTLWSTSTYGEAQPLPSSFGGAGFDRLLICDCLWMAAQHANLVGSIVHWLGQKPDSCALVVAGFHTGRSVVQDFFDVATGEDRDKHAPLSLAEIYEIDVDGGRREWQAERADETQAQAKRWVVVGVLKRRGGKMG